MGRDPIILQYVCFSIIFMTIDKIEQSVSSHTIYEKDIKYCTYLYVYVRQL